MLKVTSFHDGDTSTRLIFLFFVENKKWQNKMLKWIQRTEEDAFSFFVLFLKRVLSMHRLRDH
jgi:hypothetical protein